MTQNAEEITRVEIDIEHGPGITIDFLHRELRTEVETMMVLMLASAKQSLVRSLVASKLESVSNVIWSHADTTAPEGDVLDKLQKDLKTLIAAYHASTMQSLPDLANSILYVEAKNLDGSDFGWRLRLENVDADWDMANE